MIGTVLLSIAAVTVDLRQSGPQHKVWGRRFLGQKPEAGSSGCAPPHGLWEAPSPAHGVLAESVLYGTVPFIVPAKATPASRAPETFGPWSLHPASTGYLGPPG